MHQTTAPANPLPGFTPDLPAALAGTRPVALVTGAGIRVGRAIALALAAKGYDLILHANRSASAIGDVAQHAASLGARSVALTADLGTEQGVEQLAHAALAASPRLDALVHNAGLYGAAPFADTPSELWTNLHAVNLRAPYLLSQRLAARLAASDNASITHIGDIAGERAEAGYAAYATTKAGLLMLTRSLAVELAPRIRVNAVSPGTVAFPPDFTDTQRAAILARIPLAREGTPDDIGRTVAFLVAEAPYITGQTINVDGGRSALL
jgi:pteridine reductase